MFRASLCPKHVETEVDNKHLIVASCWFSVSSHFAHDARSEEPKPFQIRLCVPVHLTDKYKLTRFHGGKNQGKVTGKK